MASIDNPLVSVLIPCYNADKYVGEAVESALAQTYSNIEVIVVDDGSTDHSVEVLRSFGNRIRLETGPNRGACAARNRALSVSHGEFIQFLDADDLLMPEKIDRQLPYLLSGEADFVFCSEAAVGESKPVIPRADSKLMPEEQDPFVYFLFHGIQTGAPLHRRSCLENVSGFREQLPRAQEWDLHVRLGATGITVGLLREVLIFVRQHDGPRISRLKRHGRADYMLNLMIELSAMLTSGPPYLMTEERRSALAGLIHQHAIYVYRNGLRGSAAIGFQAARNLSGNFQYDERGWYKIMSRISGPLWSERTLSVGRWFKRRLVTAGRK